MRRLPISLRFLRSYRSRQGFGRHGSLPYVFSDRLSDDLRTVKMTGVAVTVDEGFQFRDEVGWESEASGSAALFDRYDFLGCCLMVDGSAHGGGTCGFTSGFANHWRTSLISCHTAAYSPAVVGVVP